MQIQNEIFLPSQLPDQPTPLVGVRRLLLQVFELAWEDYFKYHPLRRKGQKGMILYEEARAWIECRDSSPYSFVWACHHLGWDMDWVREALRADAVTGTMRKALRQMGAGRGSTQIR